jgi:ADP-ribose pyrophosphatase YjhB (NUDIX family)
MTTRREPGTDGSQPAAEKKIKRDYPDRPIVGVGAVIVDGSRALIVQRGGEPLKGHWSIPGGVVELGETLRQAIAREALEETGLVVQVGEVIEVFDSIVPDATGKTQYHYVLIDFLCTVVVGEPRPGSDAADVRWITREELQGFEMQESAKKVVLKGLEKRVGS